MNITLYHRIITFYKIYCAYMCPGMHVGFRRQFVTQFSPSTLGCRNRLRSSLLALTVTLRSNLCSLAYNALLYAPSHLSSKSRCTAPPALTPLTARCLLSPTQDHTNSVCYTLSVRSLSHRIVCRRDLEVPHLDD